VKVQRLKSKAGKQEQIYFDASLDESGWSPEALLGITDLASRLPYEEASVVASRFGLELSRSLMNDLSHAYASSCQEDLSKTLRVSDKGSGAVVKAEKKGALEQNQGSRQMVLQVDGVCVLGQAHQGHCPGMEIKSAVLYPQNSPRDRWMIADRCSAEDFLPLLAGLLQEAKISPKDTLIGLGDGASWVENALDSLTSLRITDVYHAVEYLDTIMQAMGWEESTRLLHRKQWVKGKRNARDWLQEHLPDPECWLTWSEKADTARLYLEARLSSMDYLEFTVKGYPIGSGQVEAMNKSVIGSRMKRSGMHWSEQGARAMASLRAQTSAKHSLIDFNSLRFKAFSLPAFSP
jgi:hypothetical protein